MNEIKLLALDIDGTLMGRDYILPKPVIHTVKKVVKETNIIVMLVSGRMTHSTLPIAQQLGIETPLIVYQGAMVKDIKNNITLFHQPVDSKLAKEVVDDLEKENIHVNLYLDDELYMREITEIAMSYSSARYLTPKVYEDISIIEKIQPTKVVGLDLDIEKIQSISAVIKEKYKGRLNLFNSLPEYIEVVNPNVNKGKTLVNIAKSLWNIDPENIMAIGDGNNDIDMLKLVGYGVAMGNASEEVKQSARHITTTVNEYGASEAIEKLIFKG